MRNSFTRTGLVAVLLGAGQWLGGFAAEVTGGAIFRNTIMPDGTVRNP